MVGVMVLSVDPTLVNASVLPLLLTTVLESTRNAMSTGSDALQMTVRETVAIGWGSALPSADVPAAIDAAALVACEGYAEIGAACSTSQLSFAPASDERRLALDVITPRDPTGFAMEPAGSDEPVGALEGVAEASGAVGAAELDASGSRRLEDAAEDLTMSRSYTYIPSMEATKSDLPALVSAAMAPFNLSMVSSGWSSFELHSHVPAGEHVPQFSDPDLHTSIIDALSRSLNLPHSAFVTSFPHISPATPPESPPPSLPPPPPAPAPPTQPPLTTGIAALSTGGSELDIGGLGSLTIPALSGAGAVVLICCCCLALRCRSRCARHGRISTRRSQSSGDSPSPRHPGSSHQTSFQPVGTGVVYSCPDLGGSLMSRTGPGALSPRGGGSSGKGANGKGARPPAFHLAPRDTRLSLTPRDTHLAASLGTYPSAFAPACDGPPDGLSDPTRPSVRGMRQICQRQVQVKSPDAKQRGVQRGFSGRFVSPAMAAVLGRFKSRDNGLVAEAGAGAGAGLGSNSRQLTNGAPSRKRGKGTQERGRPARPSCGMSTGSCVEPGVSRERRISGWDGFDYSTCGASRRDTDDGWSRRDTEDNVRHNRFVSLDRGFFDPSSQGGAQGGSAQGSAEASVAGARIAERIRRASGATLGEGIRFHLASSRSQKSGDALTSARSRKVTDDSPLVAPLSLGGMSARSRKLTDDLSPRSRKATPVDPRPLGPSPGASTPRSSPRSAPGSRKLSQEDNPLGLSVRSLKLTDGLASARGRSNVGGSGSNQDVLTGSSGLCSARL